MLVKLRLLDYGTEFTWEGCRYRNAPVCRGNTIACEPFLGGRFQSAGELHVFIDEDAEVEVK